MYPDLIILGPQGSGKGTQAKLLVQKFGYVYIGAGDLLREIAKENSERGRLVRETIDAGHLVEPRLISDVIKEKIAKIPATTPIIIDGWPRSMEQYEYLREFWSASARGDFKVLYIGLSEAEAIKRMAGRKEAERRADDTPEAIHKRLQLFNRETMPVVEALERDGKVIRIDGAPGVEEVEKDILGRLGL